MAEREIIVTEAFERSVVISFQTWKYSTTFSERIKVTTDDEISALRQKLRLKAAGGVYRDILLDIERIAKFVEETIVTDQRSASERGRVIGLRMEADQALKEIQEQLVGMK